MLHRLLLPTLAVALTFAPMAHADDIASYTVVVAEPHSSLVAAHDLLVTLCGSQTEGCTHITGTSFSGQCSASAGHWRMAPSVSFIPYVYIGTTIGARVRHIYRHEMAHIDDVQRDVESYVRRIATTRYPSLEACRATVELEQERIADVTRSFARKSFEVRR